MPTNDYLMESEYEAARLEKKTIEAQTIEQLSLVGLREGMSVLDAGAGTGAVARTAAKLVGPTGRVVAVDRSEERLRHGRRLANAIPNLSFVKGDLRELPLPSGEFDLVWSRFVFEYLGERAAALKELARVAKPEGKVVVGDLDGNGVFHFPISTEMSDALTRLEQVLKGSFDPFVGRKLYNLFRRSGFADIRVHILPYHVYGGAVDDLGLGNWTQKFATIRSVAVRAFPTEIEYDQFVDEFMGMLTDPDVFTYSVLIIVEGTPPQ